MTSSPGAASAVLDDATVAAADHSARRSTGAHAGPVWMRSDEYKVLLDMHNIRLARRFMGAPMR